jgi:predicted XRE-type DNA-binding protein
VAKEKQEEVIRGSGNVFADLGFERPDEELAKADLVIAIARVMRSKKKTQIELANMIGADQPAVSRLLRGHTAGYTTDRLMTILTKLGQNVEIRVSPAAPKAPSGKVSVRNAGGKRKVPHARAAVS